MSDDNSQETANEGAAAEKPKSNAMMIIIIIVVLLMGGVAAFLFLTPMGKKMIGKHEDPAHQEAVAPKDLVFFPMPELLVNLATAQKVKKPPFLRLVLKLELGNPEDLKNIELVKPRIIDQFQIFLRELRAEDLQGSAGLQRLREELLSRANSVSAPIKIRDVLFEVMLIQ
jgi:flagellar FliL protein